MYLRGRCVGIRGYGDGRACCNTAHAGLATDDGPFLDYHDCLDLCLGCRGLCLDCLDCHGRALCIITRRDCEFI